VFGCKRAYQPLPAKMGHGSSLCAKYYERIDKQFRNHISKCKVATNFKSL